MKRNLIILIFIFVLTGCGSTSNLNLKLLNQNLQLVPDVIDDCTDVSKLYYEYGKQKIYLVCLDEINLEQDTVSKVLNISTLKDYFEYLEILNSNNTIMVYLDSNIPQDEINKIKNKIDNYENVIKPAIFKSKEEWKKEMSESSDRVSEILNGVDQNPLSNTFEVKVQNLDLIRETADYIEKIDNVESVQYSQSSISESVGFVDNIISNNKVRKTKNYENNLAMLYKFDNLSIISCDNNSIYIGTKKLVYNKSFCK